MSTVQDVHGVNYTVQVTVGFTGATHDFLKEYLKRIRDIRNAICDEFGMPYTEKIGPCDTQLGKKSESLFQELLNWLITQSADFKEDEEFMKLLKIPSQ